MIMEFFRTNKWIMYLATILRIWLGLAWLMSGIDKIMHNFSAHEFINAAIKNPVQGIHGEQFRWFTILLKFVTNNGEHTGLFSVLVPWGEILVDLGLMLGMFNLAAVFFGLVMNFSFLFAGAISSNPSYIIAEILILIVGNNASRLGLDYWVLPWLKNKLFTKNKRQPPLEPHF